MFLLLLWIFVGVLFQPSKGIAPMSLVRIPIVLVVMSNLTQRSSLLNRKIKLKILEIIFLCF